MFPFDIGLSEDESVVGMHCTIGNPILLGGHSRAVNDKLLSLLIIVRSSLHLDCIISISKLGQTETASYFKTVNFIKDPLVSISV